MSATIRWLDAAKAVLGIKSDYRLGKELGVSSSRICNYYKGRSGMDDATAITLAGLLHVPAGVILCELYADRSLEGVVKKTWLDLAAKIRENANLAPPSPTLSQQKAA